MQVPMELGVEVRHENFVLMHLVWDLCSIEVQIHL